MKGWVKRIWADERVRTVVVSGVEMALMLMFPLFFSSWNHFVREEMLPVCLIGMGLMYTAWAMLCVILRLYTRAATFYLNVEWGMIFCVLTPWIYILNYYEVWTEVVFKLIPLCLLIPRAIGFIGYQKAREKAGAEEQERNVLGWLIVAAGSFFARVMVVVVALMQAPSNWDEPWNVQMVLLRVGVLLLIYVLRLGFELWLCKGNVMRRLEWQVLALQDLALLLVIGSWLVPNENLDPIEALLFWVWLLGTAAVRTVVGWKTGFWKKEA